MNNHQRDPNEFERALLDRLLSHDFPGRDTIRNCMNNMQVEKLDEYGSLKLHLNDRMRAETLSDIPVEGKVMDQDEVPIYVLLHAPDGVPSELEIYKADGSDIIGNFSITALEVYSLPPSKPKYLH